MIGNAVKTLAARFDPAVAEPPLEARIRLVAGEEAHDAVVGSFGARIVESNGAKPDAVISGTPEAWRRAADSPDGAVAALRRGGLRMRQNLHVAVGFLAGTAGEGLRLRTFETSAGAISAAEAGSGPVVLAIHGLGGTQGLVPAHDRARSPARYRVIAVDLPGLRRLGEAAAARRTTRPASPA